MNERIKELALQSGLEMCSCGCDMPTRQSAEFAKLIIQECAEVASRADDVNEDYSAWYLIEKHFRVA